MAIGDIPPVYLMNWSTWCLARRAAKENGATIEVRRETNGQRRRYVNGVLVMMDRLIIGSEIYELSYPDSLLNSLGGLPITLVRKVTM